MGHVTLDKYLLMLYSGRGTWLHSQTLQKNRWIFVQEETYAKTEKQRVIAIVEDDALLAGMFSDMLSVSGQWQLCIFSDGQSAHDSIPDLNAHLIILDVGLPHLDGASLYKMLRGHNRTRHVPIIVITGSYDWELQRMGLQSGFILQKPFSSQNLLDMISALLPDTNS